MLLKSSCAGNQSAHRRDVPPEVSSRSALVGIRIAGAADSLLLLVAISPEFAAPRTGTRDLAPQHGRGSTHRRQIDLPAYGQFSPRLPDQIPIGRRLPNHLAAFRGFLPGGLFNVCPLAPSRGTLIAYGQTSNKPKPKLTVSLFLYSGSYTALICPSAMMGRELYFLR